MVDVSVTVQDVHGLPREEADVIITLTSTNQPVASTMSFGLRCDPEVLVPVADMAFDDPRTEIEENAGWQIATSGQAAEDATKQVDSNVMEDGLVRVLVWWGLEGDLSEAIGDGELCILHFTMAENASYGDRSNLHIENLSATSAEGDSLLVGSTDGEAILSETLPPVIDSIAPPEGAMEGGTEVWIMGSNFDTMSEVTVMFGTEPATGVIVFTEEPDSNIYDPRVRPPGAEYNGPGTLIICSTPAHDVGFVNVTVSQYSGSVTREDGFEFVEPEVVLSVPGIQTMGGEEVNVAIVITNIDDFSGSGHAAYLQFELLYDPEVLVPVPDMALDDPRTEIEENAGWQIATAGQAAEDASKQVSSNVIADGRVRVVVTGHDPQPIADGELCILHFAMAEDASYGDRRDLYLENVSASSAEAELLVVGSMDSKAIIRCLPTDIDGSDVVDAIDLQLAINRALGLSTQWECDINCDGRVDAIDVQLVINAALGLDVYGAI